MCSQIGVISYIADQKAWYHSYVICKHKLASYPGFHAERGRGPGDTWQIPVPHVSLGTRLETYVETVSCKIASSSRANSNRSNGRFPSELLLAFTLPWWITGGVRYGSPCCTVVVA